MRNIHDYGPPSAGRNSMTDNETMENPFHFAVNVQVHARPAELYLISCNTVQ